MASVLATQRLLGQAGTRASALRCFVHLYDTNFAAVVRHHRGFADSQAGLAINVVRTNSLCARMLFDEFPLDAGLKPTQTFRQPHLIIAGFGNMGESIAIHAAHIGHFAKGRLRITVIDMKARYTESLFLATYPAFRKTADIEFIEGDIQSGQFFEMVQRWASQPECLPILVISVHDDTKAFACAHHCINRTPRSDFPVHVRLDTNKGFASLLRGDTQNADQKLRRIHPFGMLDACCTLDKIEGAAMDRLARIIHERFLQTCQEQALPGSAAPPGNSAQVPWEKLEEKFKESNRCQADTIEVKLRAIGCASAAADPREASRRVMVFDEAQIDLLSQMEHTRWCAERYLAGWEYGEKADKDNLISPYLVPWEKLAPSVQQYDVDAVKLIPRLLESVGKWIYRQP